MVNDNSPKGMKPSRRRRYTLRDMNHPLMTKITEAGRRMEANPQDEVAKQSHKKAVGELLQHERDVRAGKINSDGSPGPGRMQRMTDGPKKHPSTRRAEARAAERQAAFNSAAESAKAKGHTGADGVLRAWDAEGEVIEKQKRSMGARTLAEWEEYDRQKAAKPARKTGAKKQAAIETYKQEFGRDPPKSMSGKKMLAAVDTAKRSREFSERKIAALKEGLRDKPAPVTPAQALRSREVAAGVRSPQPDGSIASAVQRAGSWPPPKGSPEFNSQAQAVGKMLSRLPEDRIKDLGKMLDKGVTNDTAMGTPPPPSGPTNLQRIGSAYSKAATPAAALLTASQASKTYLEHRERGANKGDAAKAAALEAAPGALALTAPVWSKAAGAAGSVALEASGAMFSHLTSVGGIAGNFILDGIPGVIALGTGAAGVALKTAEFAGKVVGKAALPVAVGMAAYDTYKGYQKGGLKGAALAGADSIGFGLPSLLLNNKKAITSAFYNTTGRVASAFTPSEANAKLAKGEAQQFRQASASATPKRERGNAKNLGPGPAQFERTRTDPRTGEKITEMVTNTRRRTA